MQVDTAIALINQLIYMPGWNLTARDHTDRFEDAIVLHVDYQAPNFTRAAAANGYPYTVDAAAEFPLCVSGCSDVVDLYHLVFDQALMRIHCHEGREALRVLPTHWAPFHPHKVDGRERWGDPVGDITFGIA